MPTKRVYFLIFSFFLASSLVGKRSSQNDATATRILGHATAAAANLRGIDRAYALWLISRAYAKFDAKKEKQSLAQSCEASMLPTREDRAAALRQKIQGDCLRRLKQVWPGRAAELLSRADPDVRQTILGENATAAAKKGSVDDALTLLSSEISQGASYPYARAISVIKALPADDRPDKDRIFAQALTMYQQQNDRYAVGFEDLGTMIVRLRKDLSPGLVLAAIDTLLDSAREEYASDVHMEVKVESKQGALSFGSLYQYRIFQLMPVLQELAPARADSLAEENRQVVQAMKAHAGGLQSLSDSYSQDSHKDPSLSFSFAIKDGPYRDGGASVSDVTAIDLRVQAGHILDRAKIDPANALQDAAALLDTVENGRSVKADLLLGIARVAANDHEIVSLEALQDLSKQIELYPPLLLCRYLVQIADRYLRMKKPEAAMTVINRGFRMAGALYDIDTNSDDPNRALKSSWPSTTVSRSFIALASRVSLKFADQELLEIRDPDLRAFDEIQIASVLLGIPNYPAIMERRSKHDNSTDVFPIPSQVN